jgi:hypothetical protein
MQHVFTALGPGQSEKTIIGGAEYIRGEVYTDVPADHLRRLGFLEFPILQPEAAVIDTDDGCIVLGSAPDWEDDLAKARKLVPDWPVVAINGVATLYLEHIVMWCSIHGRDLMKWAPMRAERGGNTDYLGYGNFSDKEECGDFIRWNRPNLGGSSGLFAVDIALESGFEKVILCGVPLEGQQRVCSADGSPVEAVCAYESYRKGWERKLPDIKDRVRSMSGWTKELLGKPTKGWLR